MPYEPLPLPTPGQIDWAEPLNESLEILNQRTFTLEDSVIAAQEAQEGAEEARDQAAQYASEAGEVQDSAVVTLIGTAGTQTQGGDIVGNDLRCSRIYSRGVGVKLSGI